MLVYASHIITYPYSSSSKSTSNLTLIPDYRDFISRFILNFVITRLPLRHFQVHTQFLALLDYVSRAHQIKIRPSSVVCRPSDRLWHQLSLNFMHGFLSNFSCGFPWAICPDIFFIFEKKNFLNFLQIFFVFVNMGPYGSENFKTLLLLQIAFESFQTFPEFSS